MTERELMPYQSAIANAMEDFADSGLDYDREKVFAIQALMKTDFAMSAANENPMSVRMAMANLAATGLTLNPANGYAFLVPRRINKRAAIVLDISYRGLLKIATDTGAIAWGRADVVRKGDTFVYHGPARAPEHAANAFTDRGELVGVYCIAKTEAGDILCDIMDMGEIEKVRAVSDAWAKSKSGPWADWFEEMAKKAIIKRAQKTWPHSNTKLLDAIEIANESDGGYTFGAPLITVTDEQAASLRDLIEATGVDAAGFLSLFGVESVEALPRLRYAEAVSTLNRKAVTNADR